MRWLLLWSTRGFFTLRARKQFTEARNGKFYLLIFPDEVFIIFSGHHKRCPSFLTHVTHKDPFSNSSHIQCMPTLDIFGIGPILHRRGFHRTDLYGINIRHQLHPRFLSPIHLLQTVRKLVFTGRLLGLLFSPGRGHLCCFPFVTYCVSRKEPCDSSVSYLLVDCTPLFFSNFALYREMFDLR